MKTSDLVETLHDTGAFGCQILYGVVIASGPKTFRVLWESGLTNRLRQGTHLAELARDQDFARQAMEASERAHLLWASSKSHG
jgi:hypothetical protein